MKKFILSIAIFLLFFFESFSHVDHYAKYNYLEYELFRNNKPIGYHKYDFNREGEKLSIISEVSFKINKLGVDLYNYYAKSEENYEKGVFKSYSSKTKQNKKDRFVNIALDSDNEHLVIDGSSYKGKANKNFIVGTWWNHEIIKAKAQISGISGRIIEQTVTFIGKEDIKIGDKTFKTLHFNFKSSDKTLPESKKLDTDIWYEEDTFLWVKAAFDKTGHWEYRIKSVN
mgnify:CR=1 FL=1|jgi:hypothetical protein|tara:strand:+ start:625 stop:1308 length:684 start_codon:yes stop_codon:yes gene_type:complete